MMTTINLYSKEQIDEKQIGTPDDTASASGSLWARIKNALARIGVLETADTNNVKKTGTSTVTGTLEVPTTPPTPTSTVNSAYVNDATDGVNNIMHKDGFEIINGTKRFTIATQGVCPNIVYDQPVSEAQVSVVMQFVDANGTIFGNLCVMRNTDGANTVFVNITKDGINWATGNIVTTG